MDQNKKPGLIDSFLDWLQKFWMSFTTYPGYFLGLALDERLDYHEYINPISWRWIQFRITLAGILARRNYKLRRQIRKNVRAIAAVVEVGQYNKFENDKAFTLRQVICKIYGKEYRGRHKDQPCIARGAAFMISDNILLTAAHNIMDENGEIDDNKYYYVFDFQTIGSEIAPTASSVRAYKGTALKYKMSPSDDWILVYIQDIPPGRIPLKLQCKKEGHPRRFRGYYSAGFPLGIPMKLIMVGHYVVRLLKNRFAVNLDMFHGNSGSPVISIRDNVVEGILLAGSPDLKEKGDRMVFRKYRYSGIRKGITGEHCQLIDKAFLGRINQVLCENGKEEITCQD